MAAVLLPDQVVGGKYLIGRQIGQGGMGAVYEGFNSETDQRVALKILTLDHLNPANFLRFIGETKSANKVRHPGVAQVYDAGRLEDGTPFFTMEYLEGRSLDAWMLACLHQPGRCIGLVGLWVVIDLLSIVAAAHAAGLVHRDIKPSNAMIVPDPSALTGERVKLLDFGCVKLHGEGQDLTQTGALLGTIAYMAPEQVKNSSNVDGKADVYSCGVVAYQLLTGRLPHEVEGPNIALGVAKCVDPPTPIETYAPTLPQAIRAWVMRMLERNPARRPTALEAESEGRRALGMPMRLTGANLVVQPAVGPPQSVYAVTEDEEFHDPTSDLSSGALRAAQVLVGPTPDNQRALGEISPRSLVRPSVPISLSDVPSVPVFINKAPTQGIPALVASPEERTTKAAPESPPPAALALPSAPTVPQQPRRRVPWFGVSVVAVTVLSASLTLTIWQRHPIKNPQPSRVETPQLPVVAQTSVAPVPVPAIPAAREPTVATEAPVASSHLAASMLTAPPASAAAHEPQLINRPGPDAATATTHAITHSRGKERSGSSGCSTPKPACVTGKEVDVALGQDIADAFAEAKIQLCSGERVLLELDSREVAVLSAPERMDKEDRTLLRSALRPVVRARLKATNQRITVEVRCKR